MTKMRRSETDQEAAFKQAATIRAMIGDLQRTVQFLSMDISVEEERVSVFERSDPAYPILARSLAARRDTLNYTIAFLAKHLHAITMAATAEAA